ncbi:hypothetical protein FRC01_008880, partial [Tulasnella sp. 417]
PTFALDALGGSFPILDVGDCQEEDFLRHQVLSTLVAGNQAANGQASASSSAIYPTLVSLHERIPSGQATGANQSPSASVGATGPPIAFIILVPFLAQRATGGEP